LHSPGFVIASCEDLLSANGGNGEEVADNDGTDDDQYPDGPVVNGTMTRALSWESGETTAELTVGGSFDVDNVEVSELVIDLTAIFPVDPNTGGSWRKSRTRPPVASPWTVPSGMR
jgi:hypothetical protein